ncbi:MAG: sigma 54-interacting transcriptional regulator, partial [Candidatus Eisenbacteria sp.]|nr:sigma 54-interacting transcriptional regulator [Candidatus Eisenbacteria bacterium]
MGGQMSDRCALDDGRLLGCCLKDGSPWRSLARQARIYLAASAWQSAHELLFPQLEAHLSSGYLPSGSIECLCLLLASCHRLEHSKHLARGVELLDRHEGEGVSLSPEECVLSRHCLSQRYVNEGNSKAAHLCLDGIPETAAREASPWSRSRLALLRARIEATDGNLKAAERHGLEAAHFSTAADSGGLRGDSFVVLALVANMRGNPSESITLLAEAGTHYWHCNNMLGYTSTVLNRAWILNQMGHLSEAARLFREALGTTIRQGRHSDVLDCRLGLGWVAARGGDLRTARSRLLRAWREARRQALPRKEGLALEYLAETYLLSGSGPKARVAINRCKQLASRIAPEGDLALEIRIREGMLQLLEEKPRKAIALAREAVKHAKGAGMSWEQAQAYRVLGIGYLGITRRSDARRAFQRAHEILTDMGEKLELRVVEAWLKALDLSKHSQRRLVAPSDNGSVPMDASVQAGGVDHQSDQDPASKALGFWLNHPLLGPGPWLRSKWKPRKSSPRAARRASSTRQRRTQPTAGPRAGSPIPPGEWPERDTQSLPDPIWAELGLVTHSPKVLEILQLAELFARGSIPVLILGETGSGKDLLAQGVHILSGVKGPLVRVNCAAARKELFAAELFGVRRGAYTGADADRQGLIEVAGSGTIFFDEIGDLESEAQGILLEFLDSGAVRPVGGTTSRYVETRVMAATCRDLAERVAEGMFRGDLYGRLTGLVLPIAPLRERGRDLDLLV